MPFLLPVLRSRSMLLGHLRLSIDGFRAGLIKRQLTFFSVRPTLSKMVQEFILKRSFSLNDLHRTPAASVVIYPRPEPLMRSRNPSFPGTQTSKKNIRFSSNIEDVCVFKITDSPQSISLSRRYSVSDHGDVDAGSVSGNYKLTDQWSLQDSNLPAGPRFNDAQVILDSIVMTPRTNLENSYRLFKSNESTGPVLVGYILTRNLAFEKYVGVRYTINDWETWSELDATFFATIAPTSSSFLGIDRFQFTMDLEKTFQESCRAFLETILVVRLSFCLRFHVQGRDYWDNNQGSNYNVSVW